MEKGINVFSFGTFKLGKTLEKPHLIAQKILKRIPSIGRCYTITGDWDILVNFKVKDMDEYYNKVWEYGKFLDKGWGTIVSNEFKRPLKNKKKITVYTLGSLELGKDLKKPEEIINGWFEEFPNIEEVYIITGMWDVLIKFQVEDMKEYFHTTWSIGKYLTKGSGYVVSKTMKE